MVESSSSSSHLTDRPNNNDEDNSHISPNNKEKKPCKACTSLKMMKKSMVRTSELGKKKEEDGKSQGGGGGGQKDDGDEKDKGMMRKDCPVDSNKLGRHTWTFLHTTASYYPEKDPSQTEKSSIMNLINSLPVLYPCKVCANDLKDELERNPIGKDEIESRDRLEQWFCRIHNQINKKLGKEEFDCKFVSKRWRDGWDDGSCD